VKFPLLIILVTISILIIIGNGIQCEISINHINTYKIPNLIKPEIVSFSFSLNKKVTKIINS